MKPGDLIEWRGVNKTHLGRITQAETDELLVTLENGCTFLLNDLRFSKTIKVIEHGNKTAEDCQ